MGRTEGSPRKKSRLRSLTKTATNDQGVRSKDPIKEMAKLPWERRLKGSAKMLQATEERH